MLPFEDHPPRETRRFPFVMLTLLVINVAVFVYMLTLTPAALEWFVRAYGAVPGEITGQAMPRVAAPLPPLGTLLTSMFIHGGLLHLVGNMIFLWVFGDNVESDLGHLTFLGLYLAAGSVASIAHIAAFPDSTVPTIGASGAIAGVLGAYLLLFPRAQVRVLLFFGPFFALGRVTALLIIFGWFVLQVFRGFGALVVDVDGGGVAYLAHVGGFLAGFLATAAIREARHEPLGRFEGGFRWSWTFRNWLIAVLAFGGLLALGAIVGGPPGAAIQGLALGLAALVALVDGILRVTGQPAILGEGRGIGRVIAVLQILVALAVLGAVFL